MKTGLVLALTLLSLAQVVLGSFLNNGDEDEVCYGDLGCFGTGYPFLDPPYRAVSVVPDPPEDIATTFYLNTRRNPSAPQLLLNTGDASLLSSYFDPSKETKFICHGFTENGDKQWVVDMSTSLLNYGDYNVIRTDWVEGSKAMYSVGAANTRVVGAEMSLMIDRIKAVYGITGQSIHLIGHSLGAHAVGYAGERQGDIGRITGLDPAGPYFEATHPRVRLDETDAVFVDVIHTNVNPIWTLGMGINQPSGHLDFYVNGGDDQTGCDQTVTEDIISEGGFIDGGVQFVTCNHNRVNQLFMASMRTRCHEAYYCEGEYVADFLEGSCAFSDRVAEMGIHADLYKPADGSKNLIYYQKTMGEDPFCGFHYRFGIHFDDPRRAKEGQGKLFVTLVASSGVQERVQLTQSMQFFEPGQEYKFMGVTGAPLGTLTGLYFEWEYDTEWYKPWEWDVFTKPDFYIHRIDVYSLNDFTSYVMCGSTNPIKANRDTVAFFPVDECN